MRPASSWGHSQAVIREGGPPGKRQSQSPGGDSMPDTLEELQRNQRNPRQTGCQCHSFIPWGWHCLAPGVRLIPTLGPRDLPSVKGQGVSRSLEIWVPKASVAHKATDVDFLRPPDPSVKDRKSAAPSNPVSRVFKNWENTGEVTVSSEVTNIWFSLPLFSETISKAPWKVAAQTQEDSPQEAEPGGTEKDGVSPTGLLAKQARHTQSKHSVSSHCGTWGPGPSWGWGIRLTWTPWAQQDLLQLCHHAFQYHSPDSCLESVAPPQDF